MFKIFLKKRTLFRRCFLSQIKGKEQNHKEFLMLVLISCVLTAHTLE